MTQFIIDNTDISRFEVIDYRHSRPLLDRGRLASIYDCRIEFEVQDDGRTLKIFVHDRGVSMTMSPALARALRLLLDAEENEASTAVLDLIASGSEVVRSWAAGDLSGAVSRLAEALGITGPIND